MSRHRAKAIMAPASAGGFLLAAFLFVLVHSRPEPPPRHLPELAGWTSRHPADWVALTQISEQALGDASLKQPEALWKEAASAAAALTPFRPEPRIAFVRGGLFQWLVLAPKDRELVLAQAATLLGDPEIFGRIAEPLLHLTGRIGYLREHAPKTLEALKYLESLAVSIEDFVAYRELRQEIIRKRMELLEGLGQASAGDAVALVPVPLRTEDEPLALAVLERLSEQRYPGEARTRAQMDALADYALRHDLPGIEALEPIVTYEEGASEKIRARLAVRFGKFDFGESMRLSSADTDDAAWADYQFERAAMDARRGRKAEAESRMEKLRDPRLSEWQGTCRPLEVCTRAKRRIVAPEPAEEASITLEPSDPEAPPYVAVYVDDRRVGEGLVQARTTYTGALTGARVHAVEIEIVNPFNRRGQQCRARIAEASP